MALDLSRREGGPADGTQRGFHPSDLGNTIRTEALFPFSKELLTTLALGRKKKLEEFFDKGTHPFTVVQVWMAPQSRRDRMLQPSRGAGAQTTES